MRGEIDGPSGEWYDRRQLFSGKEDSARWAMKGDMYGEEAAVAEAKSFVSKGGGCQYRGRKLMIVYGHTGGSRTSFWGPSCRWKRYEKTGSSIAPWAGVIV